MNKSILKSIDVEAKLDEIIAAFRDAPRMGTDVDEPEGSRYIQISDTLAKKLFGESEKE